MLRLYLGMLQDSGVQLRNQRLGPSQLDTVTATATLKEWQQQFKIPLSKDRLPSADRRSRSDLSPEQSHLMSMKQSSLRRRSELSRPSS
jgi:hypothetical protein